MKIWGKTYLSPLIIFVSSIPGTAIKAAEYDEDGNYPLLQRDYGEHKMIIEPLGRLCRSLPRMIHKSKPELRTAPPVVDKVPLPGLTSDSATVTASETALEKK